MDNVHKLPVPEGSATVEDILNHISDDHAAEPLDALICITEKDGYVDVAHSRLRLNEIIGIIERAKMLMIFDDDDE